MKAITVYCEDEDYDMLIEILKTIRLIKRIEGSDGKVVYDENEQKK
jgi:uncharacterized protein YlbG (UPF0298 family)